MSETTNRTRITELGWRVQDAVTGVKGIVTARSEYLNGCTRYCIQPEAENNKPATEVEWVDWQQIIVLTTGCRPLIEKTVDRFCSDNVSTFTPAMGGPRRDAPRQ